MSAGSMIPLGWKLSLVGGDDIKQQLHQIHDEFNHGQITIDQYAQQKRILSKDTRALTNDFAMEQKAILAAHPALLQLSESVSIVSAVSHTLLSVTNAINLATIASAGYENQRASLLIERAGILNQVNNLEKAGLGNTAQAQILKGQLKEIDTQLANQEKEHAVQMFNNTLTQVASWALIVGTAIQSAPKIIAEIDRIRQAWQTLNTLAALGDAETLLGGLLSSVTWFAGAVLVPLAVAVGAFYGTYELIRALNPKYDQSMKELEGIIRNNWHVDSITAFLVAPFVSAYLGFASIEDKITEQLYNFINSFISTIDILPDAVNKAFGRIVIPRIDNILPTGFANGGQDTFYNQAIRDLNINRNGPMSAIGGGLLPNAYGDTGSSAVNSKLDTGNSLAKDTSKSAQNLVEIWTSVSNPSIQAIKEATANTNNTILGNTNPILSGLGITLIDINANGKAQQQLAQQQLDALNQQKAVSALQAPLIQKINDLVAQRDAIYASLGGVANATSRMLHPTNDSAAQVGQVQIEDISNQIDALNKQVQEVGNSPALANFLGGLGLSGNSGIGSIVTSALGLGDTAGWTAADVQKFIQTHDYGVFTSAANRDNAPHTPTQQEQIQSLLDAWKRNGLVGYTAADAARSLGYTPSNNSGSSNVGPGAFGGLPGQYGNPSTPASILGNFLGPSSAVFGGLFAEGGEGLVSSPTMFIAGEKGSEYVSIKPLGRDSGHGGDIHVYINAGTIVAERDLMDRIRKVLKEDLKMKGFNR